LGGKKGLLTPISEREKIVIAIQEAIATGARKYKACEHIRLNVRTYHRWFDDEQKVREDARKLREFTPANKLSTEEEDKIVATVNSPEFANDKCQSSCRFFCCEIRQIFYP
jgi:hypothetical protein